jgi:hypothetical protein
MGIRILFLLAFLGASPLLAQPETGAVRVVVTDEAGAVMPGVRIVLDGPVQRDGVTDREGTALIDRLSAGTYQLAATLHGFVDVRINIDVTANSTASQQLRLRPGARITRDYVKPVRKTVTTGCRHGAPPATLERFVKQVDAVAHVRVIEQRAEDRVPPQAVNPVVITRNAVEILGVFKAHPRWPTAKGRGEVRQDGGDLDRGDFIEVVRQICLDPLIVGREYVLFLYEPTGLAGGVCSSTVKGPC